MKPKKELLFRILKYIFEHPECANKDISAALGVPIRSVENRRSALIRKGFPIESPTQLEVVECQPRRPPSARAERVYLICELLNAESKFTLEQTARFSGLDLTLIETVKQEIDNFNEATCEDAVRFYSDRVKETLAALRSHEKKTPHQVAKIVKVPLSMIYSVMRRYSISCAMGREAYIHALQFDAPLEWSRSCVKRDHQYLVEIKEFGYDGIRLPKDEWKRYREIYELKKRGQNWTENGPVTAPKPLNFGKTAVPLRFAK